MTKNKLPPAPRHLSPAARRHWRSIMEMWVFDPAALLTLRGGLEAWDLAQRAWVEMAAAPSITIASDSGMQRQHPALKAYLDAIKEARMAFSALKLEVPQETDPAWRARLGGRGVS